MAEETGKEVATTKAAAPKPMNSIERRALKDLIDGDFSILKSEINVYAADLKQAHVARVEAEYADVEAMCREAEIEWNNLRRRLQDEVDTFLRTKREAGLAAKYSNNNRYYEGAASFSNATFVPRAKETAISSINNDVQHQVMKAQHELERQRLAMQRDVLLSGLVSGQAKDLLDKMPDSRSLLMESLRENPRLAEIEQIAIQQVQGDRPPILIGEVVTDE